MGSDPGSERQLEKADTFGFTRLPALKNSGPLSGTASLTYGPECPANTDARLGLTYAADSRHHPRAKPAHRHLTVDSRQQRGLPFRVDDAAAGAGAVLPPVRNGAGPL